MNTTSSAMPTILKVVIGFFVLSLCSDLWVVMQGFAGTAEWVRMAVSVAVIVGLIRGSESTRAIVRALSILGMLAGTITLLRMVPLLSGAPLGLIVFGVGAALIALLGSLFTFWALGRENVEMWMARRSFGVG